MHFPLDKHMMKAVVLAAFISCSPQIDEQGVQQVSLTDVSLTVSAPEGRQWQEGEVISVYDGFAPRDFTAASTGTEVTFNGKAAKADVYHAVSPASSCKAYDVDKFSVSVPAVQGAYKDTYDPSAFIMAGKSEGSTISMEPLCALLKVELEEGNSDIVTLKFSDVQGGLLSGMAVVTTGPDGRYRFGVLGSNDGVSLVPTGDSESIPAGTYYAVVYPGVIKEGLLAYAESAFYPPVSVPVDNIETSDGVISLGKINPMAQMAEEEPDDPSSDPSGVHGFDYSSLKSSGHPRLMLSARDFVSLKKRIFLNPQDNDALVRIHSAVIAKADKNLSSALPADPSSMTKNGSLEEARRVLHTLFTCSYAYRLTSQTKYLDKVRETLRAVCDFSSWYPQSYLTTAEYCFGVALAYDWLYYELSLEERVAAHKAIKELAFNTAESSSFYNRRNNWNQVCNSALIQAAIVLYEKDKQASVSLIERGVTNNYSCLDNIYGKDGVYPEGYGYWEYGTVYQTMMVHALKSVFGHAGPIEKHEGFLKTPDYMLYMSDAIGTFGYSDGGRYNPSPRLPQWYFACSQNRPELLVNEMRLLENGEYSSAGIYLPMVPAILAGYPDLNPESLAAPSSRLFSSNDVMPLVIGRIGWKNDETDIYFAMKGGSCNTSHGHMDVGSFAYNAYGCKWVDEPLMTGGYAQYEDALSAEGYSFWSFAQKSYRWDVFITSNLAHAGLIFTNNDESLDKLHDTDYDVAARAELIQTYDIADQIGGTFDMTPLYKGQAASVKRTIRLVGGELNIVDEVTALSDMDAELMWRIPTKAALKVEDDCIVMTHSDKSLYLSATASDEDCFPAYASWEMKRPTGQWNWLDRAWDASISGYSVAGWTLTVQKGKTVTIKSVFSKIPPFQSNVGVGNEKPQI